MNKAECLIKGYELGKNTRLHGEIKLANEVAKLDREAKILCSDCKYGELSKCAFFEVNNRMQNVIFEYIGQSTYVSICDGFETKTT